MIAAMRSLWMVLAVAACGGSTAGAPTGNGRAHALGSTEAAQRAIDTYIGAADRLVYGLTQLAERGDALKAFDHEEGRDLWLRFEKDLGEVDRDLATAAKDQDFALELCVACIEHDWNHNGRIDTGDRRLLEIEYDAGGAELAEGDPRRRPTFRFDHGDLQWARAMVSFQRAAAELVLAYRWSQLDKLLARTREGDGRVVIELIDADRVKHARKLILEGIGYSAAERREYLAETDDDREWVPNPRQHGPIPLSVDNQLYSHWEEVLSDARKLVAGEEGLAMKEVGALLDPELGRDAPDAFVDVGKMLSDPTDIVLDLRLKTDDPRSFEVAMRGILGHGFVKKMRRSALPSRLARMKRDLVGGDDTLDKKLRYLLWLN